MRRSSRANWKLPNTLPVRYMTCISNRSTRNSVREPFGASRMRSRRHSRNWTRFLNLGPPRSWESSWRLGCHKGSKVSRDMAVPAGPPILYCEFSLAPVTAPQRYDQCCRIGLCMRKTTNLDDISIFVAVAEAGTFSAAASYLQLPVSTISRSLTRLEKNMGLLLVRRSQRGLALTDSGKEYLLFCKRALGGLREGRELLDKNRASPSGLLRVACPMTMARDAIAPLLSKFIESFPDLRVELEAREGKSCRRIHSPL